MSIDFFFFLRSLLVVVQSPARRGLSERDKGAGACALLVRSLLQATREDTCSRSKERERRRPGLSRGDEEEKRRAARTKKKSVSERVRTLQSVDEKFKKKKTSLSDGCLHLLAPRRRRRRPPPRARGRPGPGARPRHRALQESGRGRAGDQVHAQGRADGLGDLADDDVLDDDDFDCSSSGADFVRPFPSVRVPPPAPARPGRARGQQP